MSMKSEKPVIAVALSNDVSVQSLVSSGAVKDLSERFNIAYIYSDGVSLQEPGGTKINFLQQRSKLVKWVDYFLWHLTFFKHFRKTRGLNEGNKSYKISMLSKKLRFLLTVLSLPVIYKIAMPLMENLIVSYDREVYKCLKKINPETVILPGIPFDSFGLEVMKCAQKLSIKSVMAVLHWDFFSSKGLLRSEPDIVCVWGKQMYEMVVGPHRTAPEKVKIVGVPQYEIYRNKISMTDARNHLGLPNNKKIWFFAGIGEPYDEMSILMEIDRLIGTELPSDILVLYRPHPKKHKARKNEKEFKEYKFKNIVLDPENADMNKNTGGTRPEYYANLLYSADAFISPFSTMTLEAASCGKPCLTIGFSDDLHKWKLEYALVQDHVKPLLYWKSLLLCLDKSNFRSSLKTLLEISGEPAIKDKIKEELSYIVYTDNSSYSKKLLNAVLNA